MRASSNLTSLPSSTLHHQLTRQNRGQCHRPSIFVPELSRIYRSIRPIFVHRMFGIKPFQAFLLLAMLTLSRFCTQNDVTKSSPRYMSSDTFCFPYFSSQPISDVTLRESAITFPPRRIMRMYCSMWQTSRPLEEIYEE
jgi:hypothetical protein